MLRKWVYIFTSICLLNTIFCFHAADLFMGGNAAPAWEENDSFSNSGTLLDLLVQQMQDDGSDPEDNAPLKLKGRHGKFFSRFFSLSIQAPMQAAYSALFIPPASTIQYSKHQTREATRPAYYSFLFRLKPF